ncbi:9440_t:CDS:1 [Cetraspora pellucida]|uniref:9440_t:CDS:1 n=1 Tax=Cetraspora pellucida TaxID=1433469 RepID=A0A9N9HEG4_9GLOM|nr:9440_t:CDS:1 [Cetraspora pellucida]
MLKFLIFLFVLIHVIASTSLNSLDNSDISQTIDFKPEFTDVDDVDNDVTNEAIDNNDIDAEQVGFGYWYCRGCYRYGRYYRCYRCYRGFSGRGGGGGGGGFRMRG